MGEAQEAGKNQSTFQDSFAPAPGFLRVPEPDV